MVCIAQARAILLSMLDAEERAHHGHPDFRIRGKDFATGWSQQGWRRVNLRKVTVAQYRKLVDGAWRNVAPRTPARKLDVRPLTPDRWPDVEAIFNARGCSVARRCWYMYYRQSGARVSTPGGSTDARANRASLRKLVDAGRPPGLIGYRGKTPVGWISPGPREDYARLKRSPVMKAVDDRPVWSVICFVVPSEYRGQGVAQAPERPIVRLRSK